MGVLKRGWTAKCVRQVCDWATNTAFTTHSLKPTEPYIPHLYQNRHIKHYLPLPHAKLRGGREKERE
jgi:hypothetical protein